MSHILLFATDLTTQELANDLGLTSYYDQDLFGKLPTSAAVNYTDINYGKMMVSKVYVAHLISRLGYDFLFQDTDLAWYRDPLHYFETHAKPGFDMYFQHDGWHHPLRFAPFAANTGFYFVRYNERTEHFFSMLSRMTDIIYMDKSHQSAVAMLLNEHTVQRGLKVKVLADDDNYFQSKFRSWIPSTSVSDAFPYIMLCCFHAAGYHFHSEKILAKKTADGRFKPYLFHANWLEGAHKQPVMEAIRNWFLPSSCMGSNLKEMLKSKGNRTDQCCLASPVQANSTNKFYLPGLKKPKT